MKVFIKKILAIAGIFIISSFVLDYFLSSILRKTNLFQGEVEVWNDIYESNINCEIAIYGSSKSWVQVNPTIIETQTNLKAYNFGIDGHNFQLQSLRHLEFLKHNKRPKIILICLGPHTLEKKLKFYNMEQVLPFMLWNKNILSKTKGFDGYSTWDYLIPMLRYSGRNSVIKEVIQILSGDEKRKTRKKGFKSNNISWTREAEEFLMSKKNYFSKIDENTRLEFEKFLDDCQAKNINLKLVYTPEFIGGQKKIINKDMIIRTYKEIATKKGIDFFDYSAHNICNEKSNFYNTEHLNTKGSNIFTNLLINEVIKNN